MDLKKVPGQDSTNNKTLPLVFKQLPRYMTAIYNSCLRRGHFSQHWKRVNIVPVIRLGKYASTEVSKFHPISLLNVGGKVLEKLLIDRIMHHINSNDLLNHNQYGFKPYKSTVNALMALKDYVHQSLQVPNSDESRCSRSF